MSVNQKRISLALVFLCLSVFFHAKTVFPREEQKNEKKGFLANLGDIMRERYKKKEAEIEAKIRADKYDARKRLVVQNFDSSKELTEKEMLEKLSYLFNTYGDDLIEKIPGIERSKNILGGTVYKYRKANGEAVGLDKLGKESLKSLYRSVIRAAILLRGRRINSQLSRIERANKLENIQAPPVAVNTPPALPKVPVKPNVYTPPRIHTPPKIYTSPPKPVQAPERK